MLHYRISKCAQGPALVISSLINLAMPMLLLRLGNQVPVDVELGYHLCYGDANHKHFVEPEDTTKLVDVANGISAGLKRSLNWISMPVPRNRSDEAYFAPLKNVQLHPETE